MGTAAALDLRLVEPFVVLVDQGLHFRAAAERLGIGQPALSRQMARLQHELGVTLFVREGRDSLLTPAGARFLIFARAILERAVTLEAELHEESAALRVHLGNAAHRRTGQIVSAFIAAHPSIRMEIGESTSPAAIEALRRRTTDVAFGIRGGCPEGMSFALLERAPLGLLTADRHPLASEPEIRWSDLAGESVFFGPDHSSPWNVLVRSYLAEAEIAVREVVGSMTGRLLYLAPIIAAGGVSLITGQALFDPLPAGVTWRPLTPDRPVEFGVMWDPHQIRHVGRKFVEFAAATATVEPRAGDAHAAGLGGDTVAGLPGDTVAGLADDVVAALSPLLPQEAT